MRLPSRKRYPKTVLVNDEEYTIRFVRSVGKNVAGDCNPSDRVIRIRMGMNAGETFSTFIHELIHAIEAEYNVKISHKVVYQLEHALTDILLNNF